MATKIYVGDSVKNAIEALPKDFIVGDIAKKLGLSRTQYYTVINSPEMRMDHVLLLNEILTPFFKIPTNTDANSESEKLLLKIADLQKLNHQLEKENRTLRSLRRSEISKSTPK